MVRQGNYKYYIFIYFSFLLMYLDLMEHKFTCVLMDTFKSVENYFDLFDLFEEFEEFELMLYLVLMALTAYYQFKIG